jgi:hypothetical protein
MDHEEETLAGTGVEETGPEEAGCVEPGIVDTASVVNGKQTEDKTVANDAWVHQAVGRQLDEQLLGPHKNLNLKLD